MSDVCHSSIYFPLIILVDGKWTDWGDWGDCSVTCGGGEKIRTRECDGPYYGGAPCPGSETDSEICGTDPCPSESFSRYQVLITSAKTYK